MNRYSLALDSRAKAVETCKSKWIADEDMAIPVDTQRAMATRMSAALANAPVYYWSDELLKLVEYASDTIELASIDVTKRPSRSGYYYFEQPRYAESLGAIQGITWVAVDELLPGHPNKDKAVIVGAVSIDKEGFAVRAKLLNQAPDEWSEGQIELASILQASWLFLEQRILVSEKTPVERHVARRNRHTSNDLNVVYLRRVRQANSSNDKSNIEYTCRWLVRGHWRRQYYPSLQAHKQLWILPYTKGPEGKPLKVKPTVFAVVR